MLAGQPRGSWGKTARRPLMAARARRWGREGTQLHRCWRNNYRANIGVTASPRDPNVAREPPLMGGGPFYPTNRAVGPQAFTDGLSNTIGFSEKLGGSGDGKKFHPAR